MLPVLEAGKSKVKIQQSWFLVKVLAGWQPAIFSMCLHRAFPQYVYIERDSSSYEALIPSWQSHLNLISSQRPHLQIPSYWGLGLQHTIWGNTIQSVAGKQYCHSLANGWEDEEEMRFEYVR